MKQLSTISIFLYVLSYFFFISNPQKYAMFFGIAIVFAMIVAIWQLHELYRIVSERTLGPHLYDSLSINSSKCSDWSSQCDDDEPIKFDWVASNFPSMGTAYSARQRSDFPCLVWQNRFERFTLYDIPQPHLKTRGDVRLLVAALGKPLPLDRPPNQEA